MKKLIAGIVLIVVIAGAVAGAYLLASRYLLASHTTKPAIAACTTKGAAHTVVIQDNVVTPDHTQASLCDTLTILSKDNRIRLMAFGPHDDHQPYDGVGEKTLEQGQSFTVVLDQAGSFTFHDHLDDSVIGYFTVALKPAYN